LRNEDPLGTRAGLSNSGQKRETIPYLYGIRGLLATLVVMAHCNWMVIAVYDGAVTHEYRACTDLLRYLDFLVGPFFVISGFLLTMPALREPGFRLPGGPWRFLRHRSERLLRPYYAALALSFVLYIAWCAIVGHFPSAGWLVAAVLTHVFIVHNFSPTTALAINDALWSIAVEFQCYILFAFVMLPVLRRFGLAALIALAIVGSMVPHFLLHGFLDWSQPWSFALYAMGVGVAVLASPTYPKLAAFGRRVRWTDVAALCTLVTIVAAVRIGIDPGYSEDWKPALPFGIAIAAFFLDGRVGGSGFTHRIAAAIRKAFAWQPLCRLGGFSYSIYLVHFPILRLLVAIAARFHPAPDVLGLLGYGIFVPVAIASGYLFYIRFERATIHLPAAIAPEAGLGLRDAARAST
jgi:peptidoglycan/LPS O-acetylase OafA/YrhL